MIPQFNGSAWPRASLVLSISLIGLALVGCSLAPVYERPAVTLPTTLGGEELPTSSSAQAQAPVELTAPERAFLASFAPDRDLASLVVQALTHNADHRLALAQVEQARAQYRISRADQLPAISAGAALTRQAFDNRELNARYEQRLASVTTGISDFELDFFGRMKSLSDAARARYLASTYGEQTARGALIAEVLRAYTLERTAAAALARAQSISTETSALLHVAALQRQTGLASQDDLDRQQAQADQADVAARQAADDHRATLRALRLLTGRDVVPEGDVRTLAMPQAHVAALRDIDSQLLLQRPDIRQAEAVLRAANADIGAARAAFFPSIRLSTSVGTASDGLAGLFDAGSGTWAFMPQLSLPIFDFGRNRANLDLAWTRRQAGVVEYENAIRRAFREVADTLDARATLAQAERLQSEEAARAQRRLQRVAARVDAGLVDRSDLLVERIRAEQSALARLRAERDLALVRVATFRAFYGVELQSSL